MKKKSAGERAVPRRSTAAVKAVAAACLLASCGGTAQPAPDPQLPPTAGYDQIEPWFRAGFYQQWHCEPDVHEGRSPVPPGKTRICSNELLSAAGAGDYPVGAASLRELYDAAGANVVGFSVQRKVAAGNSAAAWYWYDRVPLDSGLAHDPRGVAVDGTGDTVAVQETCTACHLQAGAGWSRSGTTSSTRR